MYSSRFTHRFVVGIAVALTLHLIALYGVILPAMKPRMHEAPARSVTLDLALTTQVDAVSAPEPEKPAAVPVPLVADGSPEPQSRENEVSAAIPTEPQRPRQALNLESPKDWAEFDTLSRKPTLLSAMRPAFAEALAAERTAGQRRSLLQQRDIARNGLAVAAYNAVEGSTSNHLKTQAGCFTLLPANTGEAIGPTGVENRWWRTACRGTFKTPFEQAALEYDALGRALGQAAGR
jgi:hypothetical protein